MIEIDQLLDVILKIESSGYTYYMNLSRRVQGKTAEIFEKLADDERKHSDRFREILGKIPKDEVATWSSEEVTGYLKTYAEISIFPKLEKVSPQNLMMH